MSKEKQIEEMAFNLIMATSPLGVKDLTKQFDYNAVATDLYESYGWRKQSEVARVVIEEFSDLVTRYVKDRDLYLVAFKNAIAYAKDVLTKKYTAQEQGSDSRQTVENEKKYMEGKEGEGNDL